MAILIPSFFVSKDNLLGEHRIFHLLKNSYNLNGYYIFHSLNIINHNSKREGEADFVILGPLGILDIEIKGSNKIIRADGKWTYINKNSSYTANESPFSQAKNNLYSLINNIKKNIQDITIDIQKMSGYGVIFPNMVFKESSVEWDKKIILDENNLERLSDFIIELYRYWRSKVNIPKGLDVISPTDIDKIKQYLRGNFETVESVRFFIKRNSDIITRLTVEQANILDALNENERILIKGLAGTGKTFLAIEQAKRITSQDKKVLFLCFNRLLAKNIYTQLKTFFDKIDVFNIDALYYRLLNQAYQSIRVNDNAELRDLFFCYLNEAGFQNQNYDYLVIDEGQDLLNKNTLVLFDKLLSGGFSKGSWIIFYDDEVQNEIFASTELGETLQQLKKISTSFTLNTNCRNPKKIIDETYRITKLPVAKILKLDHSSESISLLEYKDNEELIIKVADTINTNIKSGVKPNEITILFPKRSEAILEKVYQKITGINDGFIDISEMAKKMTDPMQDLLLPKKSISHSTIQAFKGMENEIIIIAGIENLSTDIEKAILYTGMTRARAKLYIIYFSSIKKLIS